MYGWLPLLPTSSDVTRRHEEVDWWETSIGARETESKSLRSDPAAGTVHQIEVICEFQQASSTELLTRFCEGEESLNLRINSHVLAVVHQSIRVFSVIDVVLILATLA